MNIEHMRDKVYHSIERQCASLAPNPYRVQKVLNAAHQEGEKPVKKKLSASLMLAMVMILLAATALAVATIQETGRLFAQTEQALGDYIHWPVEQKAAVVCALMEEGYIQQTPERQQLRDGSLTQEAAAQVADEAMAEFTGEDAQYASFLTVMSAAWGPFEQWSQEQKAWYSQVMADTDAQTDGKTYYAATAGALSEQEAVAIAKKEIARGFGMAESLVDAYRVYDVSLQIPEFAEPNNRKAYWHVAMDTSDTPLDGQAGLPFQAIDVFVDPDTGALLEPIEEKVAAFKAAEELQNHPLALAMQAFEASINEPKAFHTWTLEHKARWSQEIAPQIRAYLETNGDVASFAISDTMRASLACTFGLPDEQALTQEQALAIVKDTLADAFGLSDEEISLLLDNGLPHDEPALFYDVTDPERPLWRIICTMPTIDCADDAIAARVKVLYGQTEGYDRYYLVEINAYTGAVIRTQVAPLMADVF